MQGNGKGEIKLERLDIAKIEDWKSQKNLMDENVVLGALLLRVTRNQNTNK